MPSTFRRITPLDRLIGVVDQGLRVVVARQPAVAGRPVPASPPAADAPSLDDAARRESAALMRVNHAGEVAAQALYHGQALVARDPQTREHLLEAAREEGDHLVWCATRLAELDSRPSRLDALWFAGSATIGALAGLMSDRISLGFVAETERQVEGHLASHLDRLPADDTRSREIVLAMQADEARHRLDAIAHGGAELPAPIPAVMRLTARVMTGTAYWV